VAKFARAGVAWPLQPARARGGGAAAAPARHAALAPWRQQLVAYYSGVLAEGHVLPAHESLADAAQAAATASPAVQQAVLAGVAAVLPHLPQEARAALLAAVAALSDRLPLKSSVKAGCLRLQAALFRGYVLAGGGGQGWEAEQVAGWIRAAPKMLWQLGTQHAGMTRVRRRPPACLDSPARLPARARLPDARRTCHAPAGARPCRAARDQRRSAAPAGAAAAAARRGPLLVARLARPGRAG
jgi:hypothetical protein